MGGFVIVLVFLFVFDLVWNVFVIVWFNNLGNNRVFYIIIMIFDGDKFVLRLYFFF